MSLLIMSDSETITTEKEQQELGKCFNLKMVIIYVHAIQTGFVRYSVKAKVLEGRFLA